MGTNIPDGIWKRLYSWSFRVIESLLVPEVESSRTSLASRTSSRTHFEVLGLGLGLEASSPRKLACPRLEDSTIFWNVKILWSAWKIFWKTFFSGDRLKNFCEDFFFFFEIAWKIFVKTFFFFFFGEHLALCPWSLALASSIPVLGLESVCPRKGCPWPWPWIFFVSLALALASSLVSSTPPLIGTVLKLLFNPSSKSWLLQESLFWTWQCNYFELITRGGVEETRLEAKAKDTKKIRGQGQGQLFRGQTLSRPRTGMPKDQGHRRKCSPKKNGLQNFFSVDLQLMGVPKIFDWGDLNHKSREMTWSKYFKRGSFCGTEIS